MSGDYIILISVALVGSGIGLFVYRAAKGNRWRTDRNRNPTYEEVQLMVNRRVKWAAVAAGVVGLIGFAACFVDR
ncbi:MAG TPA: hypothetical protein VEC35_14225 [Noviherbaspirillum sp.]|nr:hypothetical protein [Noviherbaspirillum sp.]